jgi:hypothetical protein
MLELVRARWGMLAAFAALAASACVVVVLAGSGGPDGFVESSASPAPATSCVKPARFSATDANELDNLYRGFVIAAVMREAPARSWHMVTARMRSGSKYARWAKGDMPVSYWRPKEKKTVRFAAAPKVSPTQVSIELAFSAPGAESWRALMVFVRRCRGEQWKIDYFGPLASRSAHGPAPMPS